ncbi:MAG: hypothetical protein CFE37_05840 [Alphaproteobacteria bacterium PA4]|nr:MAG: hypothetical protein CFE37_05840 [Alphaproteobacteria bacterium PA4]
MTAAAPPLNIALVLRRSAGAVAGDFAAILLAGLLLVLLPGLLTRGFGAGADADTLFITLRAVCAMLYAAIVSWGVVARWRGRALPPARFLGEGVRHAQPGLQAALLVGAAVVFGLIIQLYARHGTVMGWLLDSLLLTAGLWAAAVVMPLVPVAVVERLGPMAAMQRAAQLTAGSRNQTLALALLLGLTLAPSAVLAAGAAGEAGVVARALFEWLAWSLAAIVPAAVYAGLRGNR